jgi:hypothetical protein
MEFESRTAIRAGRLSGFLKMLSEPTLGVSIPLSTYQTIFQLGAGVNLVLTIFDQIVKPLEADMLQKVHSIKEQHEELTRVLTDDIAFRQNPITNSPHHDELIRKIRRRNSRMALELTSVTRLVHEHVSRSRFISTKMSGFSLICCIICITFLFTSAIFSSDIGNEYLFTLFHYVVSVHRVIVIIAGFVFLPLALSLILAFIFKHIRFRPVTRAITDLDELNQECGKLYSEFYPPTSAGISKSPPRYMAPLMKNPPNPAIVLPPQSAAVRAINEYRSLPRWRRRLRDLHMVIRRALI